MAVGRHIAMACATLGVFAVPLFAQPDRPLGGASPPAAPQRAVGRTPPVGPADLADWAGRTLLPLLLVVGLIILAAAAFRKLSGMGGGLGAALGPAGRAPSGLLSVLARYPLCGGQTLVLLRIDRRVLLIAQTAGSVFRGRPGSMRTLCEISDPEEVATILQRAEDEQGESMAARFRSLLGRYERQHEPFEAPQTLECSPDARRVDAWDASAAAPERLDAVTSLRSRLRTLREVELGRGGSP